MARKLWKREELPESVRELLEKGQLRFARTYKYTWPHYYYVRKYLPPELQQGLTDFLRFWQENGYEGRFFKTPAWYIDIEGYTYWSNYPFKHPEDETLINACEIPESYMYLAERNLIGPKMAERRIHAACGDGVRPEEPAVHMTCPECGDTFKLMKSDLLAMEDWDGEATEH